MSPADERDRPVEGGATVPQAPGGAGVALPPGSVGETLRAERERLKITLDEIADQTKITKRSLLALERNDFDQLPGGIYTKNFLRAYARQLGLEPERIVGDYLAQTSPVDTRRPQPVVPERNARPRRASPALWLLAAIPIAVVIAVAAWTFLAGPPDEEEAAPPEPAAQAAATPASPERPAPVPFGSPAQFRLTLEMVADTWVDVKVDGKPALDRLVRAKEVLELPFGERIELGLGDAGAVRWALNGRPGAPLGARGEMRHNIVLDRTNYERVLAGERPAPAPAPDR